MDQYIGRLLDGRYEILEVIGTGGMAVVYKARCHRLNRLVAVKILKDEYSRDEEFRRRFHAEGEAVAMLSHPNIVQIYDVFASETANYIVMELIDGISLKQYMEKKGVLNWKETLHFAMQIAKGLEHAHSRGIIHRDIKPHNVMVLKNGSVKVMDFGIARVANKSNTLTKEALGSVHYISPEQAKGGHTDNRSDLYSLGVVMYEMMTGRPPYDGESAVAVAIQHINGGAPAPSTLNPNIPGAMEQIIMKSMSLEVRDRYVSATEMIQDMEEFRKNPAILFDYHSLLDDATRPIPTTAPVRTLADKKVQAKTGVKPTVENARLRQASDLMAQRASGVIPMPDPKSERLEQAQQRRKSEEKKMQEERSRVATTAIVIVSAVIVLSIVIFLVALFNGALLNQEKELVPVPYLQGNDYSEDLASIYPEFNIHTRPQQHSEEYEAGQIMKQNPVGGSMVQRGSDLWITISLGPEPETTAPKAAAMDNLVGAKAEDVQKMLEEQGFRVVVREESSETHKAGIVTRTEPAANMQVIEGQTVHIYVSTGPSVVFQSMPNVIGMNYEVAEKVLDGMGFENVRIEGVESHKPVGEVVYQSVEKETETDVTAEIIIHYSLGEAEETVEETEATVEDQEESFGFNVPERDEDYTLTVYWKGTSTLAASETIPAGTDLVTLVLTGQGVQFCDLYVNGEFWGEQRVEFSHG